MTQRTTMKWNSRSVLPHWHLPERSESQSLRLTPRREDDRLPAGVAQQPRGLELAGQSYLPITDRRVFGLVHPQRQQLQIGDHVVQLRHDRPGMMWSTLATSPEIGRAHV